MRPDEPENMSETQVVKTEIFTPGRIVHVTMQHEYKKTEQQKLTLKLV